MCDRDRRRRTLPAIHPPPSDESTLAWHGRIGRIILFGGSYIDATWEWDGSIWTERRFQPSPPSGWYPLMAWDAARGCVVMSGAGSDATWEYYGDR